MKRVFIEKFKLFLSLAFCLGIVWGTAHAQNETEPAQSSALVGAGLPANAQRVLPGSVPAEVNETLDKIVAAGDGKLRRGAAEVIVWAGAGYSKAKAPQIAQQLQAKWKSAGWQFEIGGEADGMALFTLLKDGAERRAVIGFYGGDADAFVLALAELHQAGNAKVSSDPQPTETPAPDEPRTPSSSVKATAGLRDLVGKWERKTSGMSSYKNGNYQGSSGNYESYEISPDGRVAYTMLIAVQNYGCRLEAFSQSRGRIATSGANLTVSLNAGTVRRDDSCSPSKNYTKATDATSHTYNWTVGDDGYGNTELCLTQETGEKFCYRRAK